MAVVSQEWETEEKIVNILQADVGFLRNRTCQWENWRSETSGELGRPICKPQQVIIVDLACSWSVWEFNSAVHIFSLKHYRNTHNNFRITRILKCLGLLGFHHYQAPLVHFFLVETLVKGTLPQVKQSVLDYFMFTVLDTVKRKELIKYALLYFEPKEKFVWCPSRIRIKFLKEVAHAHKVTEHYPKWKSGI